MAQLLKDQFFNESIYAKLSDEIALNFPFVNKETFKTDLAQGMEALELNDRVTKASKVIHQHLKKPLKEVLPGLINVAKTFDGLYSGMMFPKYVELFYDKSDITTTFTALEAFTQYSSSEFAIRHFLRDHPKETVKQMSKWSKSDSNHTRRLSSEGLRPLLPWSFNLTSYLDYPKVSWDVLDRLNNDESLYVRKSIGNHLNDLTKLAPDDVLNHIIMWDRTKKHTSWIVKKGLRTLIKNGHTEVFKLYGYQAPYNIKVESLKFCSDNIRIGNQVTLSVQFNNEGIELPIILDFEIDYCKQHKKRSTKVFKWKEFSLPVGRTSLTKSISFKQMSTRKHYPGTHQVTILMNGKRLYTNKFTLLNNPLQLSD